LYIGDSVRCLAGIHVVTQVTVSAPPVGSLLADYQSLPRLPPLGERSMAELLRRP
jgi:hypothetical protein